MRGAGEESLAVLCGGSSIVIAQRVRLFRGLVLRHTSHWHPRAGTPTLVPVPRKVTRPTADGCGSMGFMVCQARVLNWHWDNAPWPSRSDSAILGPRKTGP